MTDALPQPSPMTDAIPQPLSKAPAADVQEDILKPVAGWKTATTKVFSGLAMISAGINTAIGVINIAKGRGAYGAVNLAAAVIGGVVGKAEWDSAQGAERARNLVKIQKQLDAQTAAFGRA